MFLCYVDESGDSGTFQINNSTLNPLYVVTGLIVHHKEIAGVTSDFISAKRKFFPNRFTELKHFLDSILQEIKGNDIRKVIRDGDTRNRKTHIGYLDTCIRILRCHGVRLLGRALVKNPGEKNDDAAFYGRSMLHICQHFHAFLEQTNSSGFVVADGRNYAQDVRTTHSIFTQCYQTTAPNSFPRLVEVPVYGQSQNFAMIQLADTICSAVMFPMIIDAYGGHLAGVANVHLSENYGAVRDRYKQAIREMQYTYHNGSRTVGGMLISDRLPANRSSSLLFQ